MRLVYSYRRVAFLYYFTITKTDNDLILEICFEQAQIAQFYVNYLRTPQVFLFKFLTAPCLNCDPSKRRCYYTFIGSVQPSL